MLIAGQRVPLVSLEEAHFKTLTFINPYNRTLKHLYPTVGI